MKCLTTLHLVNLYGHRLNEVNFLKCVILNVIKITLYIFKIEYYFKKIFKNIYIYILKKKIKK